MHERDHGDATSPSTKWLTGSRIRSGVNVGQLAFDRLDNPNGVLYATAFDGEGHERVGLELLDCGRDLPKVPHLQRQEHDMLLELCFPADSTVNRLCHDSALERELVMAGGAFLGQRAFDEPLALRAFLPTWSSLVLGVTFDFRVFLGHGVSDAS